MDGAKFEKNLCPAEIIYKAISLRKKHTPLFHCNE
jgi:hypothetical protein